MTRGASSQWRDWRHFRALQKQARRDASHKERLARWRVRGDLGRSEIRRLQAPKILSFSTPKLASEMCEFLAEIRRLAARNVQLSVDLSGVTECDVSALAAFVARMSSCSAREVSGALPKNEAVVERLRNLGFFRHVRSRAGVGDPGTAEFCKRTGTQPDQFLATQLTTFVTRGLYGEDRRSPGTQNAFLEAMSNTYRHASRRSYRKGGKTKGRLSWLATAYYDTKEQRGYFAVIDEGVGIFRSSRMATIRHEWRRGGGSTRELLEQIMLGRVESITGVPHRGQGLPSLRRAAEAGRIRKLVVVTNDVFGDVSGSHYAQLGTPFQGTLLAWELGETLPWAQ